MAYEVIYTSLQSGLVSSRSGFCTVARTASIPERLAALVEKLSVFEHGKAKEKYSYNKLSYSNATYYVLTRAGDSGKDYTGRTNFIAHHLVLSEIEALQYPNPADIILGYKDKFLKEYNTKARFIKEEVDLSFIEFPERIPCKAWEKNFGDAGYASLLKTENLDIYASDNSSDILLNLFAESSSINIDKKSPWDYTFTTNYLDIESKQSYKWRAFLDMPQSSKKDICIDLESLKAPELVENRFSEYARTAKKTKMESLDIKAGKPIQASNKFVVIETKKTINPMIFLYATIIAILLSIMLYLAFRTLS